MEDRVHAPCSRTPDEAIRPRIGMWDNPLVEYIFR